MLWWQSQEYVRDIAAVLAHVNQSCSRSADGLSTDACERCFYALNKLWSARSQYDEAPERADIPAFVALLQSIASRGPDELLRDPRLQALVEFTPQVLNHHVLKSKGYRPGRSIIESLRNKATEEHRDLVKAYKAYISTGADCERLLKRVAEFLYVIRSNIAHGEKTPYGPDLEKAKRDNDVSAAALPILELIILVLLDRPDHKLLAYGTLAPGRANASQLRDIAGEWLPCIAQGRVESNDGYSFLCPDIRSEGVQAQLLRSSALPSHWDRLDRFEGERYRRSLVQVNVAGKWEVASAYIRS